MVIDTNVLVYAANQDSDYHIPCRRFIEQRSNTPDPTFLTWSICYEFLRVTTHRGPFPHRINAVDASRFLNTLLSQSNFSILTATNRHLDLLSLTLTEFPEASGNIMHDIHTAVLMREHGISQICTRDTDFYRFPFLTVVDPLRE